MLPTKSLKDYRPAAAGAAIDEYERAAFELKFIVQNAGEEAYLRLADAETKNEDCRSIETIINHVVHSGYAYANYIRQAISMNALPLERRQIAFSEVVAEIDKMLAYTAEIFEGRWATAEDEIFAILVNTRWGIACNIDQMLEHAIVHILKHRRQIEKFLLKFEAARTSVK